MAEQNLANHGKFLPPFHFFVVPVLTINLIYSLYWSGKMGFAPRGILQVLVVAELAGGVLGGAGVGLKVGERGGPLGERVHAGRRVAAARKAGIRALKAGPVVSPRFAREEG